MYNFSLFIFVFLIAFAIGEKYTTKYDNIDLDEILKSERLLKNYIDCLMDRGNCTPDGKELKNTLPDAMKTECSKCSDKQKEGSRKVLRFLLKNKRANFDELATKYDPDGSYIKKYKDELAKEGIMSISSGLLSAILKTMRVCTILLVCLLSLVLAKPEEKKYTTKYDNVDIDTILKSERLLKNYVHCLLEKGNCTPDGAELKAHLPDALLTDCSKCSAVQKKGSKKIIRYLIDNKPDWYKELETKYDPEGTYKAKYEKEIKDQASE